MRGIGPVFTCIRHIRMPRALAGIVSHRYLLVMRDETITPGKSARCIDPEGICPEHEMPMTPGCAHICLLRACFETSSRHIPDPRRH